MRNYNLGFISNEDIYEHVKKTVGLYSTFMDLASFNKNIIDPIKLTFDAKVYRKNFEEIIESECIRQMDKSNSVHIGYFHQNLFNYAGNNWYVPKGKFDVANDELKIYVEMKNKHNTMNSSSAQATYIKLQNKCLEDPEAICYLVEAISKKSQDINWVAKLNNITYSHPRIRRASMDKFYELVFNDRYAFKKLCQALPDIIEDVLNEKTVGIIKNTVYQELNALSNNTFKSLYLLAFRTYEGFDKF